MRRSSPIPFLSRTQRNEYLRERNEYLRERFRRVREYMPTATLAICYSLKLDPSIANRRKARQTIYQWARNRFASDWPGSLLEQLDFVTCSATVIGLPICEWDYNAAGAKWPALRFPRLRRNEDATRATMNEWNRLAQKQMTALWDWFDKWSKENGGSVR